MPKVPVYDNFQEQDQVQSGGVSAPNISSRAVDQLDKSATGLLNVGTAVANIGLEKLHQANQVQVNDAMNKAVAARLSLTHGDEGYTNLKGDAALTRPNNQSLEDEYSQKYDTAIDKINNGLGNDAQKRAFKMQSSQLSTQFKGQVSEYRNNEYKKHAISVQDGTIKLSSEQAALDYSNPDIVSQSIDANKAATAERGTALGMSAVEIASEQLSNVSALHHGVITAALDNNNIDFAKSYKEKYNSELTENVRAHVDGALKSADETQKAQDFADYIMPKGLSLDNALAAARDKYTGKDEEAVIREVKTRYSEKELGKSMAIRDVTNRAWEEMNTTGSLSPKIEAALNQVAPEELRQIRDWKQADLARKQRDVNKEATDNPETYYGLRLLSQQNPAAFADPKLTNLLAYKPNLSNEQFNSLVTLQSSISKGDALHSQSEKMVQSVLQSTREDIKSAGIDLNAKPGSSKANEAAKFMGTLTLAIDTANQASIDAGHGPLKPEQSKVIAMNMVRQGVEQGSGIFGAFPSKKLGYQIASDTENTKTYIAAPYSEIPTNIRDNLIKSYRSAKGLSDSQQLNSDQRAEIERAYTLGKQKGRF